MSLKKPIYCIGSETCRLKNISKKNKQWNCVVCLSFLCHNLKKKKPRKKKEIEKDQINQTYIMKENKHT